MSGPCFHGRGEMHVMNVGLSGRDIAVLTVVRYYCLSFADPDRQGWLGAISSSLSAFGHEKGPEAAVAILAVVQTMRQSRQSTFSFNCPDCEGCSAFVTPVERSLMNVIRASVENNHDVAAGHALLLCESNDTAPFLRAARLLAEKVYGTPRRNEPEPSKIHLQSDASSPALH